MLQIIDQASEMKADLRYTEVDVESGNNIIIP